MQASPVWFLAANHSVSVIIVVLLDTLFMIMLDYDSIALVLGWTQ